MPYARPMDRGEIRRVFLSIKKYCFNTNRTKRYTFRSKDIAPIADMTGQKVSCILEYFLHNETISIFPPSKKHTKRYELEFKREDCEKIFKGI